MITLISEAADLQTFLEDQGWDFFFIGGLVVQVWGEPRLTKDIDLTIFTNLVDESSFVAKLLERYSPKFHDADKFALSNRVLPMFTATGIGIDVTLGGLSDVSSALERASYQSFSNTIDLRVCSADDLIIFKSVAARPQDWLDVESVIVKQAFLDWEYIFASLEALDAYEDMALRLKQLDELKTTHYQK
jgi:hypothetical protein